MYLTAMTEKNKDMTEWYCQSLKVPLKGGSHQQESAPTAATTRPAVNGLL